MYKQVALNGVLQNCVQRLSDKAFIPFADDNTDYQQYLAWIEAGNEPTPADEAVA